MADESQITQLSSLIRELRDLDDDSAPEGLLKEVEDEVERNVGEIFSGLSSGLSSLPQEDVDEILAHLKEELSELDSENANIENEIVELSKRCVDECIKFVELENSRCLSGFAESQVSDKATDDMQIDLSCSAEDQSSFSNTHDSRFKILELTHQCEKQRTTLMSLRDFNSMSERFEAVEKLEDALTGLKIIDIEESSMRLSLNTHIPSLESILHQQGIEAIIEPSELNHEVIIETVEGTVELNNVVIFPNDLYIDDIVDAEKSFRQLYPMLLVTKPRWSSLQWLVKKVQDRIALSSLRRFLVKNANGLRRSLEYIDREDVIVAHMVGDVDALIKLPQGWPLSDLPMELKSLKSTGQHSKEVSLSFSCNIVESANSLNTCIRQKIKDFMDSIEELVMQQVRTDAA